MLYYSRELRILEGISVHTYREIFISKGFLFLWLGALKEKGEAVAMARGEEIFLSEDGY